MAIQGGPDLIGWRRSKEGLFHAMRPMEDSTQWKLEGEPKDRETFLLVSQVFKRNLAGWSGCQSQYGYQYVGFALECPAAFEEALGTARTMDVLRQEAKKGAQALAEAHPVAVWRDYPEIERSQKDGLLSIYMRLHVMTEERYQQFVQT